MYVTEGQPGCRVVLVGRTDLDGSLRHDPGVQLARVRTPLDAVGEFAAISDPADPRPAAVIVGPGELPLPDAGEFASALKAIDPEVRVIGMGDLNGVTSAFDATLPVRADAGALRRALYPDADDPNRPAANLRHNRAPIARAGDAMTAPLSAVVAGSDPVAAALDGMSSRLGAPCTFSAGEGPAPTEGGAAVRVVHGGRMLGWLSARGVDPGRLEAEAGPLAGWLMLAAQQDQLRRAAFTDELTGAFNRRYFNRFLAAAMDAARARRHTVTLLVFDIDNFKSYNDRYSHAAGDEILSETVRLLESVIRPSDRVCRVGGDEFAVIFHDPEGPRNPAATQAPQTVAQIAARFQKQICEHRFPKLMTEASGTLTISGGMATFPWDANTPEELLARADELALQSKKLGKNAITFGPGAERECRS
jgi:diguanylate cyclase (GGDEF)-like protein